nr:fibronectin type III domain-containing protein [Candidatus Prometheoarchaeum syntrophicum]
MKNNKKFIALFIMSFLLCSACGNIFASTVTPNEAHAIEPSFNKFDIESSNEGNNWRLKYQNIDLDGNYISDGLDAKLQNLANYNTNLISVEKLKYSEIFGEIRSNQNLINKEENIDVIIRSTEKNFIEVLNFFEEYEGVVKSNFSPFLNAFGGRISLTQFEAYREMLLQSNVLFFIEEDVIVNSQLYYTGKNMNLRPYVWNTLGYDGDETTALAIIDTGIDESHVMHSGYTDGDYSSKVVGWRDETPLNIQSAPYDDNGHGSHCSGISTGMGTPTLDGLGRTVATNGLNLDLPGLDIPVQDIEIPLIKFNVTQPGVIDVYCQFDDDTSSSDFVYGYAYLYYQGIEKDSYAVDLPSWTTTLTYDVPSNELGEYNINIGLSLRDGNSDGYTTDMDFASRFETHWNFAEDLMGSGDAWRGVANDTHLVGVKALDRFGSGPTTDIIDGVNWVIANKEIYNITAISMSLGGGSTSTMVDAVNNAVEEGIVVVCSAGNSGSGANNVGSPGNAENVISVAAMNVYDETTDYSSQGGSSFYGTTIKPDITAPGGSVLALQMFSTDTNDNDVSGIYTDSYSNDLMGAQGTSMSCPAVAGAANLLIEAMGGSDNWVYTAEQAKKVKSLILMTATETYPLIRELESSGTSPLLNRGTKDIHEGYGRINIDMALEAYTQQLDYDTPVSVSIASSLINPSQKHGFGRYMDMVSGVPYAIMLDIPGDADFDLYIYNDDPTTTGDPVLDDSGISSTIGQDESVTFIPSETGRYYLVVKAISGEGLAELTVGEVPITEPSNVQAIPGDAQVELTWGAPLSDGGSAITGYNIYRGLSSGSLSIFTSVGDVLTYTDLGLTNEQIYYYQISAINDEGEGPLCDEVSATPSNLPSAPQNLQTIPGDAQVELTWGAPLSDGGSAITAYNIYRGTSSGSLTLFTSVGDVLIYTDTGLTNGQTYYYQISAINTEGEGPLCNEVSATPIYDLLGEAVDNYALSFTTGGDADWFSQTTTTYYGGDAVESGNIDDDQSTWIETAVNGAGSLQFWYSVSSESGWDYLNLYIDGVLSGLSISGTVPFTEFTQAISEGLHTIRWTYSKDGSVSDGSDCAWIDYISWIPDSPLPSAPQNLQAIPGDEQVELTWDAPLSAGDSAITGYNIYRGTSSGSLSLFTSIGDVLTYTDTGLTNGQIYYYQISANNTEGEGPLCDEVSATPLGVPSAPQNLQAIPGDEQVELTWDAPLSAGDSAITGYNIYRGTSSGSLSLFTSIGDVLSYTDTGLTNGQIYYYQISAKNTEGEGPLCDEVSTTPLGAPTVPQNLQAIPGDEQVELTWGAPLSDGGSVITGYNIYRGTSSGSLSLFTSIGDVLSYTDTGLTNGQIYYYQISANNTEGEGPLCDEVSATPLGVPSAPQNLQAIPGDEQVELTWDAPLSVGDSAITGYNI